MVVEGSSVLGNISYLNSTFTVYPNPATTSLQIKTPDNIVIKSAQVFDVTGRMILDAPIINNTLNIATLNTGTYILVVADATGKSYSQRFIKE